MMAQLTAIAVAIAISAALTAIGTIFGSPRADGGGGALESAPTQRNTYTIPYTRPCECIQRRTTALHIVLVTRC